MKGRIMRTLEPRVPRAPGRGRDAHRVGAAVVPRWLREHRRAARPAGAVRGLADRPAAAARPHPEPTLREVLDAQGVRPFHPAAHRGGARLSAADWAELRAALAGVRAGD
ncbi:MAG: hypothetical protein AVDCRST_MAG41-3850 [uncultured Corynebacteriales bacterium]|uniref:Uncharacterized protein n=1 Tax=uncultured Mycobacteriales bacterium TaxID=581187 RepID=A0A6J4JPU0_9ACTN|nr:MAG: hypothetical protein AVDCRST_MAG41-3850 [uncultured Corynebacteriales bacterium]